MVEPEVAWNDSDDNMKLQEEFVSYVVARALARKRAELADLERDTTALERVRPPFPRISYTDAVQTLKASGRGNEWGGDVGGGAEARLAQQCDRPVLGHNSPQAVESCRHKE